MRDIITQRRGEVEAQLASLEADIQQVEQRRAYLISEHLKLTGALAVLRDLCVDDDLPPTRGQAIAQRSP